MNHLDPKDLTLSHAESGRVETSSVSDTRSVAPYLDPDAEIQSFLRPPQQSDEIGRLGRYRILSVLGRGGMGLVFHAEDPLLGRSLALKVMLPKHAANPKAKARFIREARSQAALVHENISHIFDVDDSGSTPFIAMPLLKGQTLAAAL